MRAVVMTDVGAPDVLRLRDVEAPRIQAPTQVLIELEAAGVNPIDTKLRSRGVYRGEAAGTVLGCDGAGIVRQVGADVSRVRPGDLVYFCDGGLGGAQGNYAQWACVDEVALALRPRSIDALHAAAAPLVSITAWESLFDRAGLQAGQTVLIHGGSGGVGHVAVQLARQRGARVCATVGDQAKGVLARDLGAERVILYRHRDFVEQTMDWTGGRGADVVFDTVGGPVFERSAAATRIYGHLVSLLQPTAEVDWQTARQRNLSVHLELMLTPMLLGLEDARAHQADILRQCAELIDSHRLRIQLDEVVPLGDAAEAHRRLERGAVTGKLVLGPLHTTGAEP